MDDLEFEPPERIAFHIMKRKGGVNDSGCTQMTGGDADGLTTRLNFRRIFTCQAM
jgi:hypothetical protein